MCLETPLLFVGLYFIKDFMHILFQSYMHFLNFIFEAYAVCLKNTKNIEMSEIAFYINDFLLLRKCSKIIKSLWENQTLKIEYSYCNNFD